MYSKNKISLLKQRNERILSEILLDKNKALEPISISMNGEAIQLIYSAAYVISRERGHEIKGKKQVTNSRKQKQVRKGEPKWKICLELKGEKGLG